MPAAFEFRNASWLDDAVYERLRARNLALCIADTGDKTTPIVETADYGYFRLRDEGYQAADIERWAAEIQARASRWREAFVYFKHEDEGKGPEFGQALMRLLGQTTTPPTRRSWPERASDDASQEVDRGALGPVAVEVRRRPR